MNKRKNYQYSPSHEAPDSLIDGPCPWVWQLSTQKIDFRRWKHLHGNPQNPIKERGLILDQLKDAIWQLRHNQSDASIISLYHSGLSEFIRYIDLNNLAIHSIADLSKDDLQTYVNWLKHKKSERTRSNTTYTTARRRYTCLKTLLMFFSSIGIFDRRLLPTNPFPNANRHATATMPYTKSEMARIVKALSHEYRNIKQLNSDLSLRLQLTVLQLLVIAKTGINPTPLSEASRDCLQPHPLQPDKVMVLITKKRRGMNTTSIADKGFSETEKHNTLPTSITEIINTALSLTESLSKADTNDYPDRLWVYMSSVTGRVTTFKGSYLNEASKQISLLHNLESDAGDRLVISPKRLRKTFSNRIWQLTNGDVWRTAKLLGNTPSITNTHYLDVTPDMERSHHFVGKAMEIRVRGNDRDSKTIIEFAKETGTTQDQAESILSGRFNTGTGRCSDPNSGKFSPKDGSPCTRFIDCFRCPNQIVLEDDLHRLYSFYWLLLKQQSFIGRNRWKKHYGWVIREIDMSIAKQFPLDAVAQAKETARYNPHPMWSDRRIFISKND